MGSWQETSVGGSYQAEMFLSLFEKYALSLPLLWPSESLAIL